MDLQKGKWVIIGDSWNIVYFLLAKTAVQASKDKSNFLTRWKTFHFQTSSIQQWTTERKEPIHNSNKKTKLLEILETSSHQNLHLQRASCYIRTRTASHHNQFRHFYWQNKLCKCYPHVKNSTLEFLPEVDSRYKGPVSTEVLMERDTWHGVQG